MSERHEGVVRQDAVLQSLIAEREALVSRREAMVAGNLQRQSEGSAMAYNDIDFIVNSDQLFGIAKAIMETV